MWQNINTTGCWKRGIVTMNPNEVVIRGRLMTDGTLELEKSPSLPAGPVEVTIRALPTASASGEDWWQFLQRARKELETSGHQFRTKEEIDAEIDDIRSGDERLEEIYRQSEEQRRKEQ
jgi:hypothetical protein